MALSMVDCTMYHAWCDAHHNDGGEHFPLYVDELFLFQIRGMQLTFTCLFLFADRLPSPPQVTVIECSQQSSKCCQLITSPCDITFSLHSFCAGRRT